MAKKRKNKNLFIALGVAAAVAAGLYLYNRKSGPKNITDTASTGTDPRAAGGISGNYSYATDNYN